MARTSADQRKRDVQRQWGADRRTEPHPIMPPPVSEGRITRGRLAIVVTITVWACYITYTIIQQFIAGHASSVRLAIEAIVYMLVVTGLAASATAYLITRIGYFYRGRGHQRAPRLMLDEFIGGKTPSVTVLVPSYQEDERTNRTTLLSAALQEYPGLRVTLLIDDPRQPKTRAARDMLLAARALPGKIETELRVPFYRLSNAFANFDEQVRFRGGYLVVLEDMHRLADAYRFASDWLYDLGAKQEIVDHTDTFFVEHILHPLAAELGQIAGALDKGADEQVALPLARMNQFYKRLLAIFDVQITSFERKKYVSLSHEPNKAMNLNSYIGLMGGRFREREQQGERVLEPAEAGPISVADSELLVVLDADSILHPEYTLRLAQRLGQREYRRVAVIQTPYSAFPGARSLVERVAGATTDIQYQLHQGFTGWDATFWVGANAMVRKQALQDIAETREERGFQIRTFIHDRTVIEDTESTVDLRARGWQLDNYPERLAFSATPPDFGALLIQRRRWANGGLLILPKLWRYCLRGGGRGAAVIEAFFRFHYLTSLAIVNVALLTLLAFAFDDRMASAWLPVTAVPYYLLYASDLRRIGYRRRDVLRVYALNLLLIPVNLGGVLKSLQQACTGRRSAFGRTPKVPGRTAAPVGYIVAEFVLLSWWTFGAAMELDHGRWLNSMFGAVNAAFLLYAIVRFIGAREAREDLRPLWTDVSRRVRLLSPPRKLLRAGARVYPLIALVLVLLSPDSARGVDLAVTVNDLPTHGPLAPGLTREAVADRFIAVLKKHN